MAGREIIDQAFHNNSQLRKRIFDAIDATPQYGPLFTDIAHYHLTSRSLNGTSTTLDNEPASKKRKLNGSLPITSQENQPREVLLEVRDISFALPQRKKLHLGIAQYGKDINAPSTSFAIFTRNPASNEVDMELPLDQFAFALRLPVPEKAAKQYNFCLLPKSDSQHVEPIIWTVNDGPLKSSQISNPEFAKIAPGPTDILENALDFVLRKAGASLTLPSADEFTSARPESHRKGEKSYHVKAFRGSKDGFLFFLSNGIFFGFKKPLSFFSFEDVESISYTSVLKRTFNLNIGYRPRGLADGIEADGAVDAVQEVEFSMLDQADFPEIDAYVKRHGLQDKSLADSRRAKKLNSAVNGKASSTQNGTPAADGDEEDTRTELEKAQQQLEDEEDEENEEEEDYDPGSDGESEGSGESEEEDDEQYEQEGKKAKGRDLVAEELGSEAEDVSVTENEEELGTEEEVQEGEDEEEIAGEVEGEEEGGGGEEEEEIYEEEDEQSAQIDVNHSAISGVPAASWGYETGMPDPEDEDQL